INLKPDWPPSYHRLAILAERYKDIATLKRMFERPELDWYEDAILMWHSRTYYDWARRQVIPVQPVVVQ
ncbi:MAG TPA: hypothetical protein VF787_18670, partial [Thermoanaerobaculia bacterium]